MQGSFFCLSRNYSFADNLCFDFAKRRSFHCAVLPEIHAPGFYDFALQSLFYMRFRAIADVYRFICLFFCTVKKIKGTFLL